MSVKLPPNEFFTFKNPTEDDGAIEITFAVFTQPGTAENGLIDDTNSYGVFLDRETDDIISLKIDESRFRFTRKQAAVLASRLKKLSLSVE